MTGVTKADRLGSWLIPGAVLLAGAALFASSWTEAIQLADSGELVAVACKGGVAHPPGYPLYTLLGRAFCALPWSTPAGRVGLLSVACGLWALWSLWAIGRRLGASSAAAAMAALALATASLFWRYASVSEVFALHVALCLAAVYATLVASAANGRGPRNRRIALAALLFGLALSNHHASAFLTPLLALALLGSRGGPWWHLPERAGFAALGLLVGLSPYLYLLWADPQALPRWGDTRQLLGLVHHVLRKDYGTLTLAVGVSASPLSAIGAFLTALPRQLAWVLLPIALWGIVLLVGHALGRPSRRWVPPLRRDMALALALAPVVCGPLFFLLFNIEARGIGYQVVERFFILPLALMMPPLAVGLGWLEGALSAGTALSRTATRRRWLYGGGLVLALLVNALANYERADASDNYAVEDYGINVLRAAEAAAAGRSPSAGEPVAMVLGEGDLQLFSTTYAQQVLGVGRRVQYLDVRMLLYPWYVDQQRRRFPHFGYRFTPGHVDSIGLIKDALARGIPVYLAVVYNERVGREFASYPVGPLQRLLARGAAPPPLERIAEINRGLDEDSLRRGKDPDPLRDPWSASLREPFARSWHVLARAYREQGRPQEVELAMTLARRWAPWLAASSPNRAHQARGTR